MRTILLAIALSMTASAQYTSVPWAQLSKGIADAAATINTVQLLGIYKSKLMPIKIGANLAFAVNATTGEITISAAGAAPALNPQYGLAAAKQTDGTWTCQVPAGSTLAGTMVVYLNGIRQKEGFDYNRHPVFAYAIIPAANSALATLGTGDVVLFDYPQAQ